MERSEGVTAVLARVMKMIDRSDGSLLRSIEHFERSKTRVVRSQRVQPFQAILIGSKIGPAAAAVVH
ncbi:hypothetical protein SAMN05444161_5672 [Rhizobiales bacterium GAS191]|nr:hypothetical protein SAMN05519103_04868 [Rhizobiales bacterium GAS113]SEE40890.1 hypothetical protein SAMN05444161_5672 [Rhizobiales bacterium GAS191]